jgi:hypothetical protein
VLLGFGCGITGVLVSKATEQRLQRDAIENGLGGYNKVTGAFEWIKPPAPPPAPPIENPKVEDEPKTT